MGIVAFLHKNLQFRNSPLFRLLKFTWLAIYSPHQHKYSRRSRHRIIIKPLLHPLYKLHLPINIILGRYTFSENTWERKFKGRRRRCADRDPIKSYYTLHNNYVNI